MSKFKDNFKNKKELVKHSIVTIIAGAVFWALGELLFKTLTQSLYTPLGIAIYFLIFIVLISIVLAILSYHKTDFSKSSNKRNIKDNYKMAIIVLLVFVVLAGVFEFIYELGKTSIHKPSSFVFLVDDSGSMQGTEQERTDAINNIMADSKSTLPYAVYKFEANATCIKEMGEFDETEENQYAFASSGDTNILNAIKTVVNDVKSGNLADSGSTPKILLISDGRSSTFGLNSTVKDCIKNGICVSCVGVEGCDKEMLQRIADLTGGAFVYCEDASSLADSLELATTLSGKLDRNLLSSRTVFSNDALYFCMRIIFLAILGVLWSFVKISFCYENGKFKLDGLFVLSILLCALGAVFVEIMASSSALNIRIVRLVFCLLWAFTPGTIAKRKKDTLKVDPIDTVGITITDPVKPDNGNVSTITQTGTSTGGSNSSFDQNIFPDFGNGGLPNAGDKPFSDTGNSGLPNAAENPFSNAGNSGLPNDGANNSATPGGFSGFDSNPFNDQ